MKNGMVMGMAANFCITFFHIIKASTRLWLWEQVTAHGYYGFTKKTVYGFRISHRVKDFFIDNYDHPMFDNGIQLVDMIYLSKAL